MICTDLSILDHLPKYYYCALDTETYTQNNKQHLRYLQLYPFSPKRKGTPKANVWVFDVCKADPEDLRVLYQSLFNPKLNGDITWVGHYLKI